MRKGTRVRIERDESVYPTSRVWRDFKGRTGTVFGTNMGEIGVRFDHPDRTGPAWFQPYEVTKIGDE